MTKGDPLARAARKAARMYLASLARDRREATPEPSPEKPDAGRYGDLQWTRPGDKYGRTPTGWSHAHLSDDPLAEFD